MVCDLYAIPHPSQEEFEAGYDEIAASGNDDGVVDYDEL